MAAPVSAQPEPAASSAPPQAAAGRLLSLDVFRGLTIAGMILVNNPGNWSAVYRPLRHAEWNGWTPTDLVFPFFLFIVGVSIVFSCEGRGERGESRGEIFRHALWRSLVLIALGLLLNGLFLLPWSEVRIPGVLQRIGVVYLVTIFVVLTTGRRARIALTAAMLLGYWALLMLVPPPGGVAGDLSPAGNLASYVDRAVLHGHMWKAGWDPEGILSTLPAVATALLGTLAGEWLRKGIYRITIYRRLLVAGIVGAAAGELWGLAFPINKTLWTSSYAVFTAGLAAVALAGCYWVVDVRQPRPSERRARTGHPEHPRPSEKRARTGHPVGLVFAVLGMNPLAIYVASEAVGMGMDVAKIGNISCHDMIYWATFGRIAAPEMGSLLWAAAYVGLWWVVAWGMYRKGIFIKL